MGLFRIDVDRLSDEAVALDFEAQPSWWAEREQRVEGEPCVVETPFQFRVRVARVREQIAVGTAAERIR